MGPAHSVLLALCPSLHSLPFHADTPVLGVPSAGAPRRGVTHAPQPPRVGGAEPSLRVLRDSSVRGQLTATTAMCIARGDDLSRVQPVQSPRARRASIVAAVLPPIHRRQVLTSSAKWRCFREPDAAFKLVAAEALAFDRTGIFPVWDTLAVFRVPVFCAEARTAISEMQLQYLKFRSVVGGSGNSDRQTVTATCSWWPFPGQRRCT